MIELLKELTAQGIAIWADGADLELSFEEQISPQWVETLTNKKGDLVSWLNSQGITNKKAYQDLMVRVEFQSDPEEDSQHVQKNKIEAIFPATGLQQGFIYHSLRQPDDDAYQTQILIDYHLALDIKCYKQAWRYASLTYPALRIAFDWQESPVQIITSAASITDRHFTVLDLSHLTEAERGKSIQGLQSEDQRKRFDLSQPGLLRFTVIKQSEQHFTVMRTQHHAIADGWSGPVLLQEVHRIYQQLRLANFTEVKAETAYIDTQAYWRKMLPKAESYWKVEKERWKHTNDINVLLDKPIDLTAPCQIEQPALVTFRISGEAYQSLKAMCRQQGVTLNAAVQFGWHKVLQVYTRDEQTIVGTTVSGRDIPVSGIENSVGLFINTLPLSVDWESAETAGNVLQRLQKNIASLNTYSAVPLASLQGSEGKLFHSLFVFENYPVPALSHELCADSIETSFRFRDARIKNDVPLTLIAQEIEQKLLLTLYFNHSWISSEKAERLLAQVAVVLAQISENPAVEHQSISLLTKSDRENKITKINNALDDDAGYYSGTLHGLVDEVIQHAPEKIAVVCGDRQLSYCALDTQSTKLARHIRVSYFKRYGLSMPPETLVSLLLERNEDMIVAILAVLKAGGAYVPISPQAPEKRIAQLLTHTQAPLLLFSDESCLSVQNEFWKNIEQDIQCINLSQPIVIDDKYETEGYLPIVSPSNLSYVIYTSGTTGKPKGVMLEHRQALNTIQALHDVYDINSSHNRVTFFSDYTFDVSVSEIFNTLGWGGELHILQDRERKDIEALSCYLDEQDIHYAFLPPAILGLMPKRRYSSLRRIIFAGEPCDPVACRYWAENYSLYNYYGPTEAAIYATGGQVTPETLNVIGQAIKGGQCYILDPAGNLLPDGVPGELYLAGKGIARGYYDDPALTAEAFTSPIIEHPYIAKSELWYRTGDLVKRLDNGAIQYLGRVDRQIKLRGFRIELNEIESVLTSHESIDQAVVVLAEQSGNKYLIAYVVSAQTHNVKEPVLEHFLSERLPYYMLPARYITLTSIPLSLSGKVDRNALPTPDIKFENKRGPRTELEASLCRLWQNALGAECVGVDDDYFTLGGNSITAIKLQALVSRELGYHFSLDTLFRERTVSKLVKVLSSESFQPIISAGKSQVPVLSYAQERLYFIHELEQGNTSFHIPHLFHLSPQTDRKKLIRAFQTVALKHTVLLQGFEMTDLGAKSFLASGELPVTEEQVDQAGLRACVEHAIQQPFRLESEPPARLHSINVCGQYYLLVVFHHICFDGWSYDVLKQDVENVYHQHDTDNSQLQPAIVDYSDYARWQRGSLVGETGQQLERFWRTYLEGAETLNLPHDYKRPQKANYCGQNIPFTLSSTLVESVRERAQQLGVTLHTFLLSAFQLSLAKLTGQSDVVIGVPSDNRDHPQTQDMIGCFINVLPIRVSISAKQSIVSMVASVQKALLLAKKHQALPFERIVEVLNVPREAARHPVFQVMFSLQHASEDQQENGVLRSVKPEMLQALYSPAKYDVNLQLIDNGQSVQGTLNYASYLFEQETVCRIARIYQRVLQEMCDNPSRRTGDINTLTTEERQMLLSTWSSTPATACSHIPLHQQFEAQVSDTPDADAVTYQGKTITYSQLNSLANRLARKIRNCYEAQHKAPMQADTPVGLYIERGTDMVVAILATLKAGGAFVPLSTTMPPARIRHMVQDCTCSIVLTEPHLAHQFSDLLTGLVSPPVTLVVSGDNSLEALPDHNLNYAVKAQDLAYIMYTSGTTGEPKGVMLEHQAWWHLLAAVREKLGWEVKHVLSLTNYTFDIFGLELGLALVSGGHLVLSDIEHAHDELRSRHQEINFIQNTPSLWQRFLSEVSIDYPTSHIQVLCGGESSSGQLFSSLKRLFGQVFQVYGPTETCIWSTLSEADPLHQAVIGKPLSGERCYVLDVLGNPVPVGSQGELYIGGFGLARGYFNQTTLTNERFIRNPFLPGDMPEERIYKTGDLARWLPSGHLEFLGRNDDQIKIRGLRIELGEIQSALIGIDQIEQAAVILGSYQSRPMLLAYVVMKRHCQFERDSIEAMLSTKLPEYMLPASYSCVASLPVNSNGKLDIKCLPEPRFDDEITHVSPRTPIETQLCELWQQVLNRPKVGIFDNYFRIGGDSLQAARLVALCNQSFNSTLTIAEFFECKSVALLAERISHCQPRGIEQRHEADTHSTSTEIIGL
ncbi:amino acid adenylation domain-containing protein [Photobacterium sp. CAU 1568]|uniref:Amino acid adenylation domain-containing protein n=1 Tax=Photobacterium arenosum TaxID=2774143 RepID=A0ABR9BNV3_9GAMM|nr:non-ribosomal peptide synthetase [Photobacterium arenosum]MBD8514254.1 amino acid adenylation domain-containing protein [Photobacterium arenosum]